MNENLELINRIRPYLKEELKDYTTEDIKDGMPKVFSQPARDKNLYMTIRDNNNNEIRINSSYRPLDEAEKWAEQYKVNDLNVVVSMFGLGNGYCARALLKRLGKDAKLLITEPDKDVFLHVMDNYDLLDILRDERVIITFWKENGRDYITSLEQNVHWTNAGAQITCVHPQYEKCYMAELIDFKKQFSDHTERVYVNRNTEVFFGISFVENVLRNSKYIDGASTAIQARKVIPEDIPAIVVAAGPSLDLNIELLKEAKGKAFILATDTALRSLKKHGIEADAVITIDPRKPVRYFENVNFEEIPLFFSVQSNPDAVKINSDKKILFGCESYIVDKFRKYGMPISEYNPGGSVATAGFSVCVELGFKRIVLIGQDLAYKGEITHADGEISGVRREEYGIRYVEGIDGKPVKTRHDWFIYLTWFESSINEIEKLNIDVIDATEGGAMIHGSRLMTLREVIDNYCTKEYDFKGALRNLPPAFDEMGMKKLRDDFASDEKDLQLIRDKALEGGVSAKRGLREFKKNKKVNSLVEASIAKITKINGQIEKNKVYTLVDNLVKVENFERIQNYCKYTENEEENIIKTFEDAALLLEGTAKSAAELKEMFEKYRIENGGSLC